MEKIEKTVFLCYRRSDLPWALAIYKDLTSKGFDVFFDFMSINSGDFEKVILGNIKARAHFLIILTYKTLERCANPNDWVRMEIETALKTKRNIVPLLLEGFDFNDNYGVRLLQGELTNLKRYNGLPVPSEYFEEAMIRLRERFLRIPLKAVLHPLSEKGEKVARELKSAAKNAIAIPSSISVTQIKNIIGEDNQKISSQEIATSEIIKERLTGSTYMIPSPLGTIFVTINENKLNQPIEVLIASGKAGSETGSVSTALGRLITMILQDPDPTKPIDRLRDISKKLIGIGGGRPLLIESDRILSLPDAIGKVLEEYIKGK